MSKYYFENHEYKGTVKFARASILIRERIAGENPTVAMLKAKLASAHDYLSSVFILGQNIEEATKSARDALKTREELVRLDPTVTAYRIDLAMSLKGLALLSNDPTENITFLNRAEQVLMQVLAKNPVHELAHDHLASVHYYRAKSYNALGRFEDAVKDCKSAITLAGKKGVISLRHLASYQYRLCLSLANCGRHREAIQMYSETTRLVQTRRAKASSLSLYEAARALTVCSDFIQGDLSLSLQLRHRLTLRNREQAKLILRVLARAGFFNSRRNQIQLKTDAEFNALRHRDGFRAFAKSVGVELPAWARKPVSVRIKPQHEQPVVAPKPKRLVTP